MRVTEWFCRRCRLERQRWLVGFLWVVVFGLLVVVAGGDGVPLVAQGTSSTTATTTPSSTTTSTQPIYEADELGLLAHVDRLRRHTTGYDFWQVWVCNLGDYGSLDTSPGEIAAHLNAHTGPYYRWLSGGSYRPWFTAGGEPFRLNTLTNENWSEVVSTCQSSVANSIEHGPRILGSPARPNGVIIVLNVYEIGGQTLDETGERILGIGRGAAPGDACLEPDSEDCDLFPANNRAVVVAGERVIPGSLQLPLLVVHEMGHSLGFPHSFSDVDNPYDNPMDAMSNASLHVGKTRVGTIAVNRYQAGWISRDGVEVLGVSEDPRLGRPRPRPFGPLAGTTTWALRPPGTSGMRSLLPADRLPEMMVVRGSEGMFVSLGARAAQGYDSEIDDVPTSIDPLLYRVAAGQEGVEAYVVFQIPDSPHPCEGFIDNYGVCFGPARYTEPIPPTPYSTAHVYEAPTPTGTGSVIYEGFNTETDDWLNPDHVVDTGVPPYNVRVVKSVGDSWLVRTSEILGRDGPFEYSPVLYAPGPFDDIVRNDYEYPIELMYTLGVTVGCKTGENYCVSRQASRAHMAVFLVRALGHVPFTEETLPPADVLERFDDVAVPPAEDPQWAWAYIMKLKDLGITTGCGDGTNYCPNGTVTRAHTAVFFVRAFGETALDTTHTSFDDVGTSWAHGWIERLQELNVPIDCPDVDLFCPSDVIVRDEMAELLTVGALSLQDAPATEPPELPPGMPRNFGINADRVVSWDEPYTRNADVATGYDISFGVVDGLRWIASLGDSNTVDLQTLVGQNHGQELFVRVRARNDYGASEWTKMITFAAPPPAPANAAVTSDTPGQVTITWDAPTGTGGGDAAIAGYRIDRQLVGDAAGYTTIVANTASTDTTYTDTGLPAGTYTYAVYAINKAGLTSPSGAASAEITIEAGTTTTTTQPTTTTTTAVVSDQWTPRNVQLDTTGDMWVITWDPPASGTGDLYLYQYRMYFATLGTIDIGGTTLDLEYDLTTWVEDFGQEFTFEVRTRYTNTDYSEWTVPLTHP